MYDGIRKFQEDHGLAVDGIMKPGGPTEKKLAGSPLGSTTWTFSPTKPPNDCSGQWILSSKSCVGEVCLYVWECIEKADDSPRW